jgi:hypothetical protein
MRHRSGQAVAVGFLAAFRIALLCAIRLLWNANFEIMAIYMTLEATATRRKNTRYGEYAAFNANFGGGETTIYRERSRFAPKHKILRNRLSPRWKMLRTKLGTSVGPVMFESAFDQFARQIEQ